MAGLSAPCTPPPTVRYDIPYFAHQQLDPAQFPWEFGLPVGGPEQGPDSPHCSNEDFRDWNDSEDEDDFNHAEENISKRPKRSRSSSKAMDSSTFKKLKISGGRPAVAKKVTAELDSDDELIVRMKNAKYLEKDIAQRLRDEGRISYHPKTIGTRWARLKRALAKQQDEMLDAELSDWHEGDDDVLTRATQEADEEIEKQKKALDAKKWRMVADKMKTLKPVTNFSQNACRNRYEALQNGTAKTPPEVTRFVTEKTKASVRRRKANEAKIAADQQRGTFGALQSENIERNSWNSRTKIF